MFNLKYIFFSLLMLITFFVFFTNIVDDVPKIYSDTKVINKNINKNINIESKKSQQEMASSTKINKIDEEVEILDNISFLGQSLDSSGQYQIKLRTLKTINLKPSLKTIYAIPFSGVLEHESKTSQFVISLVEDYMNYTEFIFFDIKDNFTGKTNSCSLDFLGELEKDTIYNVKFNYYDDDLVCILTKTEKMSEEVLKMKEKMSKPIKLDELPEELQEKLLGKLN